MPSIRELGVDELSATSRSRLEVARQEDVAIPAGPISRCTRYRPAIVAPRSRDVLIGSSLSSERSRSDGALMPPCCAGSAPKRAARRA